MHNGVSLSRYVTVMDKPETFPDMEVGYVEFQPLFYHALAKLAREGFIAAPGEHLDLIHDFFATQWQGLASRYDPHRGRPEGYVYVSFVRFARSQIIAWQHRQERQRDLAMTVRLVKAGESASPIDTVSQQEALKAVEAALMELPALDGALLQEYFSSDNPSQRKLARAHSLSRYEVAERLVNALGEIAVRMGELGPIPGHDRAVAQALWGEGRTIKETAARLRRPTEEVSETHSRIVKLLAEGLKRRPSTSSTHARRQTMSVLKNAYDLFKQALVSTGNEKLLEELRFRAKELQQTLMRNEEEFDASDQVEDSGDLDPEWVARVYEALGVEELTSRKAAETYDALLQARESDEREIGISFKKSLLVGLPPELTAFGSYFAAAPRLSEMEQRHFWATADVQAGLPGSEELVPYGLGPLGIFYTTKAVVPLAERLMKHQALPSETTVAVIRDDKPFDTGRIPAVPNDVLVREFVHMTRCHIEVAKILLRWLIDVAQYKPLLFVRGKAEPMDSGIKVTILTTDDKSLDERWGLRLAPKARRRAAIPALGDS